MQQIYLAKTTYVHAQIFFNAMKKKKATDKKKGGGGYTFTLSRGDNSVPFQSTGLFTLGFTEYFIKILANLAD